MTETPQNRRRRVRRTVAAASLATFALAWGVIAGTGSMGASTATSSSTATSGSSAASSSSTYDQRSDDDWSAASQQQSDLTTRQS